MFFLISLIWGHHVREHDHMVVRFTTIHIHLFCQKFAEVRNIMKKKYHTVCTGPNPIVAMI